MIAKTFKILVRFSKFKFPLKLNGTVKQLVNREIKFNAVTMSSPRTYKIHLLHLTYGAKPSLFISGSLRSISRTRSSLYL